MLLNALSLLGNFDNFKHLLTRNTCMQQPLAYVLQTLFQHEVFVITPTLNGGSRCSRHVTHVCHGNTIIFLYKPQTQNKAHRRSTRVTAATP
jgi:hypothetical protein